MNNPLSYPIAPEYLNRLGGILLPAQLTIGSYVAIQGHRYSVISCKLVTIRLYVSSNIVTVSYGSYKLRGTYHIKKFANLLGIINQSALIHCFFQRAVIKDTIAEVHLYFHSFTDENIFITWNS